MVGKEVIIVKYSHFHSNFFEDVEYLVRNNTQNESSFFLNATALIFLH